MRVLVVEDDMAIGRLVRLAFERDGQDVVHATTASKGIEMADEWKPDVVVLDLGLPDMNGFDVTKQIRESSEVPILILTARGLESERVEGLDIGADDYMLKPFSIPELTARVRALNRRSNGKVERPSPASIRHRDLYVDVDERRVQRGEDEIALTKTEFDILRMLMLEPGKLVARSAIAHAVWGRTAHAAKNLLDVHMSYLRRKLDDAGDGRAYIETVRGEGFRLVA